MDKRRANRSGLTAAVLLAATLTLVACGNEGMSAEPRTVVVIEDEPYRRATAADGVDSTVDIYVGDGNESGLAVVLLHGYGSSGPGRPLDDLGPLGDEIARLGVTVFSFGWQSANGFSADSVEDFSCVGPFVAARAAEFGADPDAIVVIGHSMGAESGAMLALSSFDLPPSSRCTETGQASSPVAFLGIGGSYGMVGGPLDDAEGLFRSRTYPRGVFADYAADEEVLPGLTAAQLYQLDGYSAIPPAAEIDIVLVVGSEDQFAATDGAITAAFAVALEANGIDSEVVVVEGADHDNIVDPATEFGQAALSAISDLLADVR